MEITSSSVLSDQGMFLPSGQCSVPPSPLLRPGSDGGASFTSPAGIDLDCLFAYLLPNKGVMLAVWFNVPSSPRKGSNDFAVAILEPFECDQNLLKLMTKGSEKGPLKASKAFACWNSLVVRATMSDTPNAVLKVDLSNVPLSDYGVKVGSA